MYTIVLQKNPTNKQKYRATFPNGDYVDFGLRGYSDYTLHKNPLRMRSYVSRHAGKIPSKIMNMDEPQRVHKEMLKVNKSSREKWGKNGIKTAGFWSRWLLWSQPSVRGAIRTIENKFNVKIKNARGQ